MGTFRAVVESHLKDLTVVDMAFVGYVEGAEELQKFMDDMRASGYMFVNRSSNKGKKAYYFQRNGKNHNFQINFFGPLFQINKNSLYECSQGKTKNRSRNSVKDNFEIQNDDYIPPTKKRVKDQASKKIGCEASMHVLEITIFPDFTIPEYVPKGSTAQSNLVRTLKEEAKKTPGPNSFVRFMIKVSQEIVHNHTVESCTRTLNLHPKLIEEIKSLTKKRVCSVKEVKMHLKEYVENTFIQENNIVPDVNNTCFYPTEKVIHFHMHKDRSISSLYFNQDALMKLVKDWSLLDADDMFLFRPYTDETNEFEYSDVDQDQTFLFCHQTSWQKHLLQRYGNYVCILETGVHKGVRDSFMKRIPLYFLSVKTNVGYTCVGWFIIQEESSALLQEALSVFFSCNTDWQPQYFLTNCTSSELNAVQTLFPSTIVYYSPFHREQTWCRWLKVKDNVTSLRSERTIMGLWRAVARSCTETELEKNLALMKEDDSYSLNQKAQDYFTTKWLSKDVVHLWIEAYQTDDFLSMMYTSNGMEMQCKALKLSFKATSLTELAKHIVEDHLPNVLQKYCHGNKEMSTFLEDECMRILPLLKDRPAVFVSHVVNRFSTAVRNYSADDLNMLEDGSFSVTSDFGGGLEGPLVIRLDNPSCSCADFSKWRLPCEHMCAVFAHVSDRTLQQLPTSYLESPYLTLDSQFCDIYSTEPEYEVVLLEDANEEVEEVEEMEMQGDCIIDYNNEYVLVNECSPQSELGEEDGVPTTVEILGLDIEFDDGQVVESETVDKVQADFRTQLIKVHNMSYFADDVVCLEEGISILNSFEGKITAQANADAE